VQPVLDCDRGLVAGRFFSRRVSDLGGRGQLEMECDVATVGERRHVSGGIERTNFSSWGMHGPCGQSPSLLRQKPTRTYPEPQIEAGVRSDRGLHRRMWSWASLHRRRRLNHVSRVLAERVGPGSGSARCASSPCAGLGEVFGEEPVPSRDSRRRCVGSLTARPRRGGAPVRTNFLEGNEEAS